MSNGVVNKHFLAGMSKAASKAGFDGRARNANEEAETKTAEDMEFVYPYGASLSVAKPGITVLTSGHMTYPVNRPVLAVSEVKVSKLTDEALIQRNHPTPCTEIWGPPGCLRQL